MLKNNKYNIPNWGLCFLLVGITGNSIDKIFNGFVTDFIVFKLSFLDEIILNIADIYLIIGVIWLTIITLFYSAIIWYEGNKRNILLIDKNFQRDYSIRLASITIIGMFFSTMLTFLILRFQEVQITVKISLLLLVFQIGFLCFLSLTIYFFGIIESHKSCGAIFAFKKYIEGPMDNSFKLRENDAHKEILAECANLIRKNKLKNND